MLPLRVKFPLMSFTERTIIGNEWHGLFLCGAQIDLVFGFRFNLRSLIALYTSPSESYYYRITHVSQEFGSTYNTEPVSIDNNCYIIDLFYMLKITCGMSFYVHSICYYRKKTSVNILNILALCNPSFIMLTLMW